MGSILDELGPIYKKFYYDCPKLDNGTFCNYDHTEILTEIPESFFINDTSQKTIDKCYSSCKKCINYGNEENHNCSECISNYYPHNLTNNNVSFQCYPFNQTMPKTTIISKDNDNDIIFSDIFGGGETYFFNFSTMFGYPVNMTIE